MLKRCLLLLAVVLVLSAAGCGKSTDGESAPIDEAALIQARVEMHGNRVCAGGTDSAGALVERFRMNRITIENATLQTFPDPQGPTLNPGGPFNNYCWWVLGADCPVSWYGDEKIDFTAGSDLQGETAGRDLDSRCRKWLEENAGIELEEVVAVSLYQDDWMSRGFEGFDEGSYPVYIGLVPAGLIQERQQARVAQCTMKVLGATEGGDTNTIFGYVESLEFGI